MNPTRILHDFDVTELVIASVVVVSLIAFSSERIKRALLLSPYRVKRGEVYRLFTGGWVHADGMHLAMNMFVLYMFAGRVVAKLGPMLFLGLYISAVVVAFLPTTLRYANQPAYGSLGASGAVAAVMLSAILLYPRMTISLMFIPIPIPGVVFGALYIAYSVWRSHSARDNINHDAHFSGAIYGALATFVLAPHAVENTVRVVRHMLGV